MKRAILSTLFTLSVIMLLTQAVSPAKAEASGCVIQFTTANSQVKKGDTFTVVCQVTSESSFLDAEFRINFDSDILQFQRGGKKVSASGGVLTVSSTGNETATKKKTFSLQFAAIKNGRAAFSVDGTANVTDQDGEGLSVSSNRLEVTVSKKRADKAPVKATEVPVATPEPVLSKNNRLKTLKTSALAFQPQFSPEITEYAATVDCNTDILYISFETEDGKSRVQPMGNEKLQTGINDMQIVVTAEDGGKNVYRIAVTRETAAQTAEREKGEVKDTNDISFHVTKKNDQIFLSNQYEFEVLDTAQLKNIPAGYVQSNIDLNGVTVPAFTMENDLENNYLILYLKGPSGKATFYQFDRLEKTLQRYTGSMIEKVNKSAGKKSSTTAPTFSNYILLGIIVGLILLVLCMLIAMLKMAMRKKEQKKETDFLDF